MSHEAEMTGPGRTPGEGNGAPVGAAGPLFQEAQAGAQDEKAPETGTQAAESLTASGVNKAIGPLVQSETMVILSRPLYEIGNEFLDLVDLLTERGGEMDEESIKWWDDIRGKMNDKVERSCLMVRMLEAHGKSIKEEAKRLTDRATAAKLRAKRLKHYIQVQMERVGMRRLDGDKITAWIQKNAPGCEVFDIDNVPPEHVDVTITMTGVGWDNLQEVLRQVIPDQTDPDAEVDHWGGLWKVDRKVRTRGVIDEWKINAGAEDVAGTKVEQSEGLRIK